MSPYRSWSVVLSVLFLLLAGTVGTVWWFRPAPDIRLLQRRVESAIESKDFDTASRLADRLINRNPHNATALLQRGRVCAAQERWEEALSFFGRIPDESPFGADARYFEGLTFLEMHRAKLAERAFLKTIELAPDHPGTHEELAAIYALQLRVDEMRGHLSAILAARPWSLDELTWFVTGGLTWGVPAQRVAQLQSHVRADPSDIASSVALVQVHQSLDQTAEADSVLRELQEQIPEDARVHALLAESALQHNDLSGAAEALSFDPADTPMLLWLIRGQYAAVSGHIDDAVESLSEAVRLAPDNISACYRLGQALKEAGQEDAAEASLERAKLLDRLNHRCMLALGVDSQTDLDSALTEIGDLLIELGRWIEAGLAFERLVAREDPEPEVWQKYQETRRRSDVRPRLPGTANLSASKVAYRPVHATNAASPNDSPRAIATVRFLDQHHEAGVDFRYFTGETGLRYLLESMGGGVATLDFDGDGWPDLFFPQGTRLPVNPVDRTHLNSLFRNVGGAHFEDVATQAGLDQPGYGIGCSAGDYDNDGFQDLFVSRFGTNLLYRNNGDGTFADVTDAAGISGQHLSTSVAFADLDRDGNADLFVVTYLDFQSCLRVCRNKEDRPVTCHPRAMSADQDILFQNRGDGTFSNVTESAGITALEGKGLGVVVADLDDDGWPDVYVANDTTPNFLYHNRTARLGDEPSRLQFEEIGVVSGTALSAEGQAQAGMGIACADFDGNGHLDLYVTNYLREYNTLYLNSGNLSFRDETRKASLVAPTLPVLGFGTQAIDAGLKGSPDLFVANGHVEDVRERGDPWKMPPQFFHNLGNAYFADLSRECGAYFMGEYLGRSVSRLDWDRDGRPDLVVVHQDRPVALLHNETDPGNRIVLDLIGVRSNRDATNARIVVKVAGHTQVIEIHGGDGYLSTNERRQIIGIGAAKKVDELEIRWPSGEIVKWVDIDANRKLLIVEGRGPIVDILSSEKSQETRETRKQEPGP